MPAPREEFAQAIEFQRTLDPRDRHARGVHYTHEPEIQRVIQPTIVRPWQQRIAAAPLADLPALHAELTRFRVLDPACGCANFLIIAFHALRQLEAELLARAPHLTPAVRITQCLGLDSDADAIKLARAALRAASGDPSDLTATILHADALLCELARRRRDRRQPALPIKEQGPPGARRRLPRPTPPALPGRPRPRRPVHALVPPRPRRPPPNGRAGLVATNTIRDNDSRRASLDYILANGATITEAVSTQIWPDAAGVHVSIVNWIKGESPGPKFLYEQIGDRSDAPWRCHQLSKIPASLSPRVDVTGAHDLPGNDDPKVCFQGLTPGHRAFVVDAALAETWLRDDPRTREVLHPYLIGDDLLDAPDSAPTRWLIDFADRDLAAARRFIKPFAHLEADVCPARQAAAAQESARNAAAAHEDPRARQNSHHRNFLTRWWIPAYRRDDLLAALSKIPRYIACSRVTRRPIFEFIPADVRPGDALQVFTFADDFAFGVLQSAIHWQWFLARCSALKRDPRYTSRSVYSSFPWPTPDPDTVTLVARAAEHLRRERRRHAGASGLRTLHRHLEATSSHPLHAAQADLDAAVRAAYGMHEHDDPLAFLLDLNRARHR
jgi:hypothetical protein